MPSPSSDWTARQPHVRWVARMTKRRHTIRCDRRAPPFGGPTSQEHCHAESRHAHSRVQRVIAMTLYRDTTTSVIFTEHELLVSLGEEIDGLDDEDYLKQEVQLYGDAAIREYVIECFLVGIYSRLDRDAVVYRRNIDGQLFYSGAVGGGFDDE